MKLAIRGLEISPRQTGKTTRMVTKARELLDNGITVRFVCPKGMKAEFKRQLPGATVLADGESLPHGEDSELGVWFYDEFEWLKSAVLRPNAYYATSPRFMRTLGQPLGDDLLLQLLQANGGCFERIYWTFDMTECIREARLTYTPEEFRCLYLGEFLR